MPSPAPKRLPPLLRHAWYGLNQGFRQRIAHLELTPDQFSILRGLSEGDPEGLTQRAISDLMASDPNTITSTLSRMENAGLITRHPHELDRRAHRVRICPKGKQLFDKAKKIALQFQDQILENLATIAEACALATEKPPKNAKRAAKERRAEISRERTQRTQR